MEKYNAVDGCPKCGCLTTFDRYIEDIKLGGRVRRKCTRCDYLWWCAPLDAKVEKITPPNNESAAIALCKRAADFRPSDDSQCPMLLAALLTKMETIAQSFCWCRQNVKKERIA
jgi:hypothetical protein